MIIEKSVWWCIDFINQFMRIRLLICVLLLNIIIACGKDDTVSNEDNKNNYELECIWDKDSHCAFTSLVKYNNKYYCCFREASTHIPINNEEYGKIRILESIDGCNWYSVDLIEDKECDLRDPQLNITPDGKLMLLCGSSSFNSKGIFGANNSRVYFYDSNFIKSPHSEILIDGICRKEWLWKITWYDNIAYGIAYSGGDTNSLLLVKSTDGVNYSSVSDFDIAGNEADITFIDKQMLVVCRSIDHTDNGYIGYSSPPYDEWEWNQLNHLVQSPELINIEGTIILAGRGASGATIYTINNCEVSPKLVLPSDGDAGYPGLIYDNENNKLWMSYYTTPSTTQIYLAKIFIKDIL